MCCRLKIALFEFFARGQESCTRVMTTKLPCTLLYVVLLVRISHLISHFCFRYNKYQAEGLPTYKLDNIDFGRRMAVERELIKARASSYVPPANVIIGTPSQFFKKVFFF